MEYVSVDGTTVPALGVGTSPMKNKECKQAVTTALDVGYRHIDTAQMYNNEDAVGAAIASSDVDREEVFVTTKLLQENLQYDDVLTTFQDCLSRLTMEYVDLLLIHSPNPDVPIDETISAMNQLQENGTVRHIGVSNFSVTQLQDAIDASDTPILTNQVKYHPFTEQSDLLAFCIDNDIMLTAYSPLAKGRVPTDETLAAIGNQYGKSAAQVALRWLVQQKNVSAIPKASSRDHLRENLDIFDFSLGDDEMAQIFQLQDGLLSRLREKLGL